MRHPLFDETIDAAAIDAAERPPGPRFSPWLVTAVVAVLLIALHFSVNRKTPEETAQPILAALEKHRQEYGRYPDNLGDLVARGISSYLPRLSSDIRVRMDGFDYFYDKDLDVFQLGYEELPWLNDSSDGWAYLSSTMAWVPRRYYFDYDLANPFVFVLDVAGSRFREGSHKHLDIFVRKFIEFNKLSELTLEVDDLSSASGPGELIEMEGQWAIRHSAGGRQDTRYYFVLSKKPANQPAASRIVEILRVDPTATMPWFEVVWHERKSVDPKPLDRPDSGEVAENHTGSMIGPHP